MADVIYIDVYFFTDLVMDLVSILITSLIISVRIKWYRAALGAVLGAAFSAALIFFDIPPIPKIILSLLWLILIAVAVFGTKDMKKTAFGALFCFVTELFAGGAVFFIYYYADKLGDGAKITFFTVCLVSALGFTFWTLWGKSMKRRMDTAVIPISVSFDEKNCDFYGLVDSGSLLCEPISRFPVILIKETGARALLSESQMNCLKSGVSEGNMKLFAIPAKTASGTKMFFGFRPKSVKLHNTFRYSGSKEIKEIIIAVDFSEGGFAGCPCLVPLTVL